jgi:DNA ligase 1
MIVAPVRIILITTVLFFSSPLLSFADPVLLEHPDTYTGGEAISGWLMSEKLDGIRGYWNGTHLLTRQGQEIHAPSWFTAALPHFALDGELWRDRNDYAFVQETVLDDTPSENWRKITYNIFEVPFAEGDFPTRMEKAEKWFDTHPAAHVRMIEQIVCKGPDHLRQFLKKIEALGGEGAIVKNPVLSYQAGRSPNILKVKNFSDMEGTVIAHNPGNGKLEGMMGSLTLRLQCGIDFKLGTGFTLEQRLHPPPVGTVVTFKYQGFTKNGIPRFASFMRERKD